MEKQVASFKTWLLENHVGWHDYVQGAGKHDPGK